MTALRRTKANGVSIDRCYTVSELEKMKEEGRLSEAVTRVDEFVSYHKLKVSAPQARRFSNGGELDTKRFGGKKDPGLYLVYSPENEFLGVGEIDSESTVLAPKRVYRGE